MSETTDRELDRKRIIEACGGRLTANDDHFIDRVTDVVTKARAEQREQDAKACDEIGDDEDCGVAEECAESIRRGSQ